MKLGVPVNNPNVSMFYSRHWLNAKIQATWSLDQRSYWNNRSFLDGTYHDIASHCSVIYLDYTSSSIIRLK